MNPHRIATYASAALLVAHAAGCKKTDDNKLNYAAAINTYYQAHPACLWADEIKFPVQADTSDASKTSNYDALVDQGLLVRTTGEKKVFIVASKQVNNYDLSDKGRSAWTADTTQPGYGNFCYGHRKVATIDTATPASDQPGATTQVSYHYSFSDAPAWATAPETQNAFSNVRANLAGPMADAATLTNTTNGWAVTSAPHAVSHGAVTDADGKIVSP